jgi:hypothetical protein
VLVSGANRIPAAADPVVAGSRINAYRYTGEDGRVQVSIVADSEGHTRVIEGRDNELLPYQMFRGHYPGHTAWRRILR